MSAEPNSVLPPKGLKMMTTADLLGVAQKMIEASRSGVAAHAIFAAEVKRLSDAAANRFRNTQDGARLANAEVASLSGQPRDAYLAKLDDLVKAMGKLDAELIAQRAFYSSKLDSFMRFALATPAAARSSSASPRPASAGSKRASSWPSARMTPSWRAPSARRTTA
jgi:hypothetical protein